MRLRRMNQLARNARRHLAVHLRLCCPENSHPTRKSVMPSKALLSLRLNLSFLALHLLTWRVSLWLAWFIRVA